MVRPSWVLAGDFCACPLQDLRVSNQGNLSVWVTDEQSSNVKDIVVAMASGRNHFDKVDYALFPESLLASANIEMQSWPGDTAHLIVNPCHRHLVKLSASKLVNLAWLISEHGTFHREQEEDVQEWLTEALEKRIVDVKRMNPELKKLMGFG